MKNYLLTIAVLLIVLAVDSSIFVSAGDGCGSGENDCNTSNFTNGCDVRASFTVPSGTHVFSSGIDICEDGVVLSCAGATFDGSENTLNTAISIFADSATVQDCNIQDYSSGMETFDSNHIVRRNTVINSGRGIDFIGDNYNINNNLFKNLTRSVDILGNNTVLDNNNITEPQITTFRRGIVATGNNIDITNNLISGERFGIILNGTDNEISNNNITGSIVGVQVFGINNDILTNDMEGNFLGIEFHSNDSLINGNDLDFNSEGIELIGSNNMVTTNQINDGGDAIAITGTSNTISGNSANRGDIGFSLEFTDGNILSGNTANNNSQYGIAVIGSSGATITSNTLSENEFYDIFLDPSNNIFCDHTMSGNIGINGNPVQYVNSALTVFDADFAELIICGASNVNLGNLVVSGSNNFKSNAVYIINSQNINLTNVTSNNNSFGFLISSSSDVLLDTVFASENLNPGIFVSNSTNISIINSTTNQNPSGIFMTLGMTQTEMSINLIENQAVSNFGDGINFPPGLTNSKIVDNSAINNLGLGIGTSFILFNRVGSGNVSSYNNLVKGNFVEGSGQGMSLFMLNSLIENNFVTNNGFSGMEMVGDNNTLKNNTAILTSNFGMIVSGNFNNITENNLTQNNNGILFGLVRDNNFVINNTIYNNTGTGLDLKNAINLTIEDNVFYDNFIGMDISGTVDSSVEENKVCFNTQTDIVGTGINYNGTNNTCEKTVDFDDLGSSGCSFRCPVVLIPGITGSELLNNGELVWLDVASLIDDFQDDFLDVLKLDTTSTIETTPGVDITVGEVIEKLDFNQDVEFERFFLFNPITNLIIAGGKAKQKFTGPAHFHDLLIEEMENSGFVRDKSLFTFPYDWRKDNRISATKLDEKISEIQNQIGIPKVSIVAHSMGGLITREYLRNNSDKVNKFIMIGTPNQGATDAYDTLKFGRAIGTGIIGELIFNPNKLKEISTNFLGVHQLLPSDRFISMASWIFNDQFDTASGQLMSATETYTNNEDSRLDNQILVSDAIMFSSDLDDDIEGGVETHLIVGSGHKTLLRITKENKLFFGARFRPEFDNGDGTVSVSSAIDIDPADLDNIFYVDAKHAELPSTDPVPNVVVTLLNNSNVTLNSEIKSIPFDAPEGTVVSTHSPVNLLIYNQNGEFTGSNLEGGISAQIQDSEFYLLEGSQVAYIPNDNFDQIWLKSTSTGSDSFDLFINTDDSNGVITSEVSFENIAIDSNSKAVVFEKSPSNFIMKLDFDGDNILESLIAASGSLTAKLVNSSGNITSLKYDLVTSSYKDNNAVNDDVLLRLSSSTENDLLSKFVGLVYKTGDNFIHVDNSGSNILTSVASTALVNGIYIADTNLNIEGSFPGIIYAVVSDDGTLSSNDLFLRIDPVNGWFIGSDPTPDSLVPNFDSFEVVFTNDSNTTNITVVAAYDDLGNQINSTENLTLGLGLANETFDVFTSAMGGINQTNTFNTSIDNIVIYVNGIIEGVILKELPDLEINDNDVVISPSSIKKGNDVIVTATVHNIGNFDVDFANIQLLVDDILVDDDTISVLVNQSNSTNLTWVANTTGSHNITIFVNKIGVEFGLETDINNNRVDKNIVVNNFVIGGSPVFSKIPKNLACPNGFC